MPAAALVTAERPPCAEIRSAVPILYELLIEEFDIVQLPPSSVSGVADILKWQGKWPILCSSQIDSSTFIRTCLMLKVAYTRKPSQASVKIKLIQLYT